MNDRLVSRRAVLAGLGAGTVLLPTFAGVRANAAALGGYKALVCVFLFGGMDGHDVLIPYDNAAHTRFTDLRQALAAEQSRGRAVLQSLNPRNAEAFGERQFALPPETPNLKRLFDQGEAAIVSNVGPLVRPVTRTQWENRSVSLPPRLFSHNDQQSVWQASAPEGARFGWGGLFADAVLNSGGNTNGEAFSAISTTGDNLFLTGEVSTPFSVGRGGPAQISPLKRAGRQRDRNTEAEEAYQRLRRFFGAEQFSGESLIARDVAAVMGSALVSNETFQEALEDPPSLGVEFPDTRLGGQLRVAAETIAVRVRLGTDRQIFFTGTGGYDTHSGQAQTMPELLAELDAAIGAFNAAMVNIGANNDVTLFTASDFGRTFAINGDGTDHGWGGNHFVVGGAVEGGRIIGDPPPPGFDHAFDAGRGRLIPQFSVDQYAAELGSWFGLSRTELEAALPNLANFDPMDRVMA